MIGTRATSVNPCADKAGVALQEVAAKAEGYDAADLRVLADRALHAAARRHLTPGSGADAQGSGALMISPEDLADAEQGFQPAAAWGVGQLQVSHPCQTYALLTTILYCFGFFPELVVRSSLL